MNLNSVVKRTKSGGEFQISDFMTKDEQRQLKHSNFVGKRSRKQFDEIDAYAAEIMGRFGYEAYRAWNAGEISPKRMSRLIAADRAREKASLLNLEAIVMAMVGSCVQKPKGGGIPKGVKLAHKIYKDEIKIAKGEK